MQWCAVNDCEERLSDASSQLCCSNMEDNLELDLLGLLSLTQLLRCSPPQSESTPSERARKASHALRQKIHSIKAPSELSSSSTTTTTTHSSRSRATHHHHHCSGSDEGSSPSPPAVAAGAVCIENVLDWSLLCVGCSDGAIACWHSRDI